MSTQTDHHAAAMAFLAERLGADAPAAIELIGERPGGELEGEGAVSIYRFRAAIGGEAETEYVVVAGETEPNYYPTWGLDADRVYSLHLGTRFMLVLEIGQLPLDQLPSDLPASIAEFVASAAPGEPYVDGGAAAAFVVDDELHAVWRARIGDDDVYVIGGGAPPGIYRLASVPPHAVYRIHLGNVIRAEPPLDEDADEA